MFFPFSIHFPEFVGIYFSDLTVSALPPAFLPENFYLLHLCSPVSKVYRRAAAPKTEAPPHRARFPHMKGKKPRNRGKFALRTLFMTLCMSRLYNSNAKKHNGAIFARMMQKNKKAASRKKSSRESAGSDPYCARVLVIKRRRRNSSCCNSR